jgi:hypothetical protein
VRVQSGVDLVVLQIIGVCLLVELPAEKAARRSDVTGVLALHVYTHARAHTHTHTSTFVLADEKPPAKLLQAMDSEGGERRRESHCLQLVHRANVPALGVVADV